jgi:thiol:disulfide interchange protein
VEWTPCIGPILTIILAVAASTGTVAWRDLLLLLNTVGPGLPFIVLALVLALVLDRARGPIASLRHYGGEIEVTGFALMVGVGVLFVTGTWQSWFCPFQRRLAATVGPRARNVDMSAHNYPVRTEASEGSWTPKLTAAGSETIAIVRPRSRRGKHGVRWIGTVAGLLEAIVGFALSIAPASTHAEIDTSLVAYQSTEATGPNFPGGQFILASQRSHFVVVAFFASWCVLVAPRSLNW